MLLFRFNPATAGEFKVSKVKKVPAVLHLSGHSSCVSELLLLLCIATAGEFKLSKVKKVPAVARARTNPFFWRYSFDSASMQVLTDRPVTDFVVQ
jgi:hypothetical protein